MLSSNKYQLDISSFPTRGRISPTECYEQIPGSISFVEHVPTRNEYRPEVSTDQVLVTQREGTISQPRDSFATPQTVGENTMPHVHPRSVVEDPLTPLIPQVWRAWKILWESGMITYKSWEIDGKRETQKREGKILPNWYQAFPHKNPKYTLL